MSDIAQDLGGVVLLPCPFCGGRGEVGGLIPWVECQACEASGPQAETEDAAIAAWNTRTHSAEIAGALRDAERMDYIERTFTGMSNGERYLPLVMGWGKSRNGRTLREACDKYMAKEGK